MGRIHAIDGDGTVLRDVAVFRRAYELIGRGHQVLHGYTPANEPWQLWKELERGSADYKRLKQERCAVFHQVFDGVLPDWRERVVIELQGTPLTHRHYLRMHQGSYGPAWPADRGPFPGGGTPV